MLYLVCWAALLLAAIPGLAAEDADPQNPAAIPDPTAGAPADPERWNLFYQATSIGDMHAGFPAAYSGPLSLANHVEHEVSLTTTLFFGLRLTNSTAFYFNPEIAGGRGFSGTDGIANAPNGEMPRITTATPKAYIARAYFQQDFGFGDATEAVKSNVNQLAGTRPATRYTIYIGRFSVTDFFDNNRYSHDPRSQFMTWGTMSNGAWDYPADTRGYTWGWVHEFHTPHWSVRYASAAEPRVANGLSFDRRLFRDRGDIWEGEYDWTVGPHPGAVRLLGFALHTDSGRYADALRVAAGTAATPDVAAAHIPGTTKYGTGLSIEQELTQDVGVFGRWGWNDGKTESFAFTSIDRLYEGGVSFTGRRWHRDADIAATALTGSGISGVHRAYLAAGGLDFLIGDGRLDHYGPEYVWETYYNARLRPGLFVTVDAQRVANPAYNQDRGPVWIGSLRVHIEFGKDAFSRKP
ncbi:MAG TPA: carbohydrate porin [Bryobacteraceae bacterium]|nr:carbohydrate porin [Bryobacteraceae bacterium]